MGTCALPRGLLTWPFIMCRGSHSAAIQLRVILSRELSFEVLSSTWVDFLGVNSCVPVTSHSPWGGASTLLSYHACGSSLVMALSWVVSVPGSPSSGVGTSRVKLPPTGTRTHGLEATFLFSSLLLCMVEAWSLSGNVFTRRWLSWATPLLGDASARRWLERSTCWLLFLGSLKGSHHALTLTFGQCPGTERYKNTQNTVNC